MIFTDIAWFLLNRSRKMTGYIHKRKHELLPQPGLFVFIFRFITYFMQAAHTDLHRWWISDFCENDTILHLFILLR
jgi:hypothetical protein